MKSLFISHSYGDDEHNDWVDNLAIKLQEYSPFDVIYDKFDMTQQTEKNKYMEDAVFSSDVILVVASDEYTKKANNRQAGVGIETSMIVARHWDEIDNSNQSTIIAILKSNKEEGLPRFLSSKLRINFDSGDFDKKFKELLNAVENKPLLNKPSKRIVPDSIQASIKNFNKTEEILTINYKNRKKISYESHAKIKYEFWECLNPSKQYFLILFPNTNLTESIKSFLNKEKKLPKELTVLKEKSSKTATDIILNDNNSMLINEFSYSQFIWDYCIDKNIKNLNKDFLIDEYYIDQDIYSYYSDEKEGLSINTVTEFIKNESSSPIMMIMAQAGSGKTTFCEKALEIIDKMNEKVCVFISSEEFKEYYDSKDLDTQSEINTIYDLYDSLKKIDRTNHIDENIFNLGLSNGNLTVIIDGLDEIITLFQKKFNLDNFFDSLINLNLQLGKCKIIISSREYYWKDHSLLKKEEIILKKLKGFDNDTLDRYLKKRFSNEKAIKLSARYLDDTLSLSDERKIMPFLVDLICESVEEQIDYGYDNLNFKKQDYSYANNDELIDNVLYAILNRELTRQTYPESTKVKDLVTIFKNLTINYGETFSHDNFEYIIQLKYPTDYIQISSSLKFSHLLLVEKDYIKFKYDILENYFLCLYLMDLFSLKKENIDCPSKHLSKLLKSNSPIFKDIKKYFQNGNSDIFILNAKKIISCLIKKYKETDERDNYEKVLIEQSISAILYLLIEIKGNSLSKEKKMDLIKDLYDYDGDKLEYLFIIGDFYELDFSNMKIWSSKFQNYNLFLNSTFNNSEFCYCVFKDIKVDKYDVDLSNVVFDETCELNELNYLLKKENTVEKIEKDLLKLLKKMVVGSKIIPYSIKNDDEILKIYLDCLIEHELVKKIETEDKKVLTYQLISSKVKGIKSFLKSGNKNKKINDLIKNIKHKLL